MKSKLLKGTNNTTPQKKGAVEAQSPKNFPQKGNEGANSAHPLTNDITSSSETPQSPFFKMPFKQPTNQS